MNGIHDMGGMHGMGPVQHEKNEPVFHHRWEARAFAITRAMGGWGKWNLDASRHQRELIDPARYLTLSYYEKWVEGLIQLSVKAGLLTQEEADRAKRAKGSAKQVPPMHAEQALTLVTKGAPAIRNVTAPQRFQAGQRVRARNINPTGHTRLPRYARGKVGTIDRDHGVYVFPDTNAHFQGEDPQRVYSVRFSARELWGKQASPRDSVYIDMWDTYLEPA
ncbi:MAG: nitrile hydratase subunit beta [Bryobacteraceae bacterium]|jgi:nitrile hydratase